MREVEGLADRLRHIKDPTPGRVNDKEEAVSGGDYQLLQLLVGQHRRLVVALSVAVQAASDRLEVLHCQSKNCELVHLARHRLEEVGHL